MRAAFVYILRHRTLFALAAALLWLLANMVIGFGAIVIQSRGDLRQNAADAISHIDSIYKEIDGVFADLLTSSAAPCSTEMILQMRRNIFLNRRVQDILYFAGGGQIPTCSANLGILENPAPLPAPEPLRETRFNRQVWFEIPVRLFSGEIVSYMVKQDRFAITADMSEIREPDIEERWETFVPDGRGNYILHVDGEEGLHQEYLRHAGALISRAFMHSRCSTYVGGCITIAKSPSRLIEHYGWLVIIGGVLSLVTSVMVYSIVNRSLTGMAAPQGRIRSAIARRKGFYCLYQPVVELSSGQPVGCEVLARFEDELGPLLPDQFIPIVLRLGKSWEFTEIILNLSLPELRPLCAAHPGFRVSVNFFPCDLENRFLNRIAASAPLNYATEHGMQINCEVLETGSGEASMSHTLQHLHEQGFTVAIDDFGTGSSNLKQIRGMKANFIKVDKSFIGGLSIENASVRSSLIPHIVEIAREVGAEVIAEGVETAAQVQVLEGLKIRYGQGFFFAPPTGIDMLEQFAISGEALLGLRV